MTLLTACLAVMLALTHLVSDRLRLLGSVPRSAWKSGAGGVAVAYVFLHILPDLASHQKTIAQAMELLPETAEKLVFLIALAGLTAFYGLERFAKPPRDKSQVGADATAIKAPLFWTHIGSFSLYNMLIGYLLVHREVAGTASLLLYFFAMATHFLAIDVGLRLDHKRRYDRFGRWIIAASVIAGWALAAVTRLPDFAISLLFAFLAGGIVLNVLKEELPEDRQSRFLPFLAGVVGYSLVLAAI